MGEVKRTRKERSDRKYDAEGHVSANVDEMIECLKYIGNKPRKDIADFFVRKFFENSTCIERVSSRFRHEFTFEEQSGTKVFLGNIHRSKFQKPGTWNKRIYTRLTRETTSQLEDLQYALSSSKDATIALVVSVSIKTKSIVEEYLRTYPPKDDRRYRALEKFTYKFFECDPPRGLIKAV